MNHGALGELLLPDKKGELCETEVSSAIVHENSILFLLDNGENFSLTIKKHKVPKRVKD